MGNTTTTKKRSQDDYRALVANLPRESASGEDMTVARAVLLAMQTSGWALDEYAVESVAISLGLSLLAHVGSNGSDPAYVVYVAKELGRLLATLGKDFEAIAMVMESEGAAPMPTGIAEGYDHARKILDEIVA